MIIKLFLVVQVGEITFFDIDAKEDISTLYISGYIDTLMIAHQTDSYTHLLVGEQQKFNSERS